MTTYKVCVDSIDGEETHCIKTIDKERALKFLQKHDHEGAGIFLQVADYGRLLTEEHDNEKIYNFLSERK
jgi:hypothetical protein